MYCLYKLIKSFLSLLTQIVFYNSREVSKLFAKYNSYDRQFKNFKCQF